MRRIEYVVEGNPALASRAAESTVFAHLKRDIAEFEDIRSLEPQLSLELGRLRAETRLLAERLHSELECIEAARQLSMRPLPLPNLTPPPASLAVPMLVARAAGIIMAAEHCLAELIEAGMHPRKLEDVSHTLRELTETHMAWSHADARHRVMPKNLDRVVRRARKRIRQLYLELLPAMTAELVGEWKAATLLGRKHRDALPAPRDLPRLTAGAPMESTGEPADRRALVTAGDGRKKLGLAQRVVLRIAGVGKEIDGTGACVDDASVDDIGRLPAATD